MTALQEAVAGLKERSIGIATLREFQRACEAGLATSPEEAGLLRLLADLTGRFVERYDDQPLVASVAKTAYDRLVALAEAALSAGTAEEKLKQANALGRADLG